MAISSYVGRGDYGVRESMASLYQSPETKGREDALYGGQILEASANEAWIRAQLKSLAELLAEADPSQTPIKIYFIQAEIDKLQEDLARLSEGVGAESMAIAQQQNSDLSAQSAIHESMEKFGISKQTTSWNGGQASGYGDLPYARGTWASGAPLGSYGTEPMGASGQKPYSIPSYMAGWMTPMGVRPMGAQTRVEASQKAPLYEQIAMQQAGNIGSLQDYLSKVEPYIPMRGQAYESASQRLTPQSRNRRAAWAAASQ